MSDRQHAYCPTPGLHHVFEFWQERPVGRFRPLQPCFKFNTNPEIAYIQNKSRIYIGHRTDQFRLYSSVIHPSCTINRPNIGYEMLKWAEKMSTMILSTCMNLSQWPAMRVIYLAYGTVVVKGDFRVSALYTYFILSKCYIGNYALSLKEISCKMRAQNASWGKLRNCHNMKHVFWLAVLICKLTFHLPRWGTL